MTRRAILIGLLASAVFAGIGFFNDMVMKQTFLFSSYLPTFAYGLLILFVLAINPLLARIGKGVALGRGELAVIVVLTFPACFVAGRTLVHHFPGVIMTPKHYNRTQLGWQRYDLLRRVPPVMLAGQPPELRAKDILHPDWIMKRLRRAVEAGEQGPLGRAAQAIPAAELEKQGEADAGEAARALNRAILGPALMQTVAEAEGIPLPHYARQLLSSGFRNSHEEHCFNRMLLGALLEGEFPDWLEQEESAVDSFQAGLAEGRRHISVGQVPWQVWGRTILGFWGPLLVALCVAYIGFALVAQRQWAENEHLPFPIVTITEALLPDSGTAANRSLLRDRGFWACAGIVAFVHLNNYAAMWWPSELIEIPRTFNLTPLASLFPVPWNSWRLFDPIIYFTVVGIAYFISSEASLSVGIAPFVYALIAGVLGTYGVTLEGGGWNSTRTTNFVMLGGYAGLFLMLLYTGRQHFAMVVRRAFGFTTSDDVHDHERLGLWVFLAGAATYIGILWYAGVHLVWAVWYFVLLWVVYTVVARIVAETGMILIHPVVFPGILAVGFFGETAVGLNQVVAMVLVSTVIGVGCHVVMLPLMTQGLRLVRGREKAAAGWCTVSLVVALAVAIPTTIYFQYDSGATSNNDGWTSWLPYSGLEAAERVATKMDAQGTLDGGASSPVSTRGFSPGRLFSRASTIGFLIAFFGVIVFETMRLRFLWWPLHPIMFVVLDFWVSRQLAVSFLLGWLIKTLVCRYGGSQAYRKVRPIMFGLIVGDIGAQMLICLICTIYSLKTGCPPKAYWVLPG